MRTFAAALAAALLLPSLAGARAPVPSRGAADGTGMRSLGMGNAYRAVASTNEAIFFNLAGMAQAQKYELDASFLHDPGTDLVRYDASVVDSVTSKLATGLAYSRLASSRGATGDLQGNVVHLGFALPAGSSAAVGFGLKWIGVQQAAGAAPGNPRERTSAVTADAGILVRAGELVKVGLTGTNLVDVGSRQAPRQLAAGLAVGRETAFQVAVDGVLDLSRGDATTFATHAGAEVLLADLVALRAGAMYSEIPADLRGRTSITFGAALVTPQLAVELAFAQNVTPAQSEDRLFGVGIKMFVF